MQQQYLPAHGLPINIVCILNNGIPYIGFNCLGTFPPIFDMQNQVMITDEYIDIKGKQFNYQTGYRIVPELLEYLQYLELENPWEKSE